MEWVRKNRNTPVCIEREQDGIVYFTFASLEKLSFMKHAFTTRIGGVSTGDCESMNLNFDRDEKAAVLENFRRMGSVFHVSTKQFVLSHQTHTTNVRRITGEDRGKGVVRERDYENVDGLITNEPGIVLTTIYADCIPLFFADPVKKAVGVSHSGWKGTVGKMGLRTVRAMTEAFGTDPRDLRVVIAPGICKDCYEISRDVAEQFLKAGFDSRVLEQKSDEKYQLDLWEANREVLLEAGVLPDHIEVTDICTCCNSKALFSHRASHGKRGNLAAMIAIED